MDIEEEYEVTPDDGPDWSGTFSERIPSLHDEIMVGENEPTALKQKVLDLAAVVTRIKMMENARRSFLGVVRRETLVEEVKKIENAKPEKISLFLAVNKGISPEYFETQQKAVKLMAETFGSLAQDTRIDEYVTLFGFEKDRWLLRHPEVQTIIKGNESPRDSVSVAEGITGEMEDQLNIKAAPKENIGKALDNIKSMINTSRVGEGKEAALVFILAEGKESERPNEIREKIKDLEKMGVYVVAFYPEDSNKKRMDGYFANLYGKAYFYSKASDIKSKINHELQRAQHRFRKTQIRKELVGR